jgi:acyl carrier protein
MTDQQNGGGATLLDRVRRIIVEELDVRLVVDEVTPDTLLLDGGLQLDSFAIVELITELENRFDFEFGEEDLSPESFVDLRTLARVVERNLTAR